ncbi:MAG: AAA family ATPase [Candidatus Micrarchaeota archaeon]|nr:AAA family ATPase [Candidatus Micrarchaeota archaeon]
MADTINFLKEAILDGERKMASYAKPARRDLYAHLAEKPRMHVIYGLRGSGKTTLLFQRFADFPKGKRIYLSGDEMELLKLPLPDVFKNLKYVMDINGGAVFLDEITRIAGWEEQLKMAYDNYPELAVYVSGSSTVELAESKGALARRARYHRLLPLSFRELMRLAHGIELEKFNLDAADIYTESIKYDLYFKGLVKGNPRDFVQEYAEKSQPFMLEADEEMLMDLMDKIIFSDIAKAYSFEKAVLNSFQRLLLILSTSEKTSYDNLSNDLKLSKGVIGEMIRALIGSGILKAVMPHGSGRIVGRKTWRYFFIVPAIREMYMRKGGADGSLIAGLTREDMFVSHLDDVFYLPSGPDFIYHNKVFEVGGASKGFGQVGAIKTKMRKFVIYDGLEIVREGEMLKIPLYIFLSYL